MENNPSLKKETSKPSLRAICRTECIDDFRSLLREIAKPVEVERRKIGRTPQSLILCIQPLDNSLRPVGSPFQAITRDVSEKGLGFLYGAPFPTKYVRVSANQNTADLSRSPVSATTKHTTVKRWFF